MIVVYTAIILSVLIFVHEFGHFGAAKLSGVKVNEFALGMGPAFFKKQRGETQYSLRIFPIGGFCTMEGQDEESEDERSFDRKPARIKAFILVAGSFMNVALAVLILAAVILYAGTSLKTEISSVAENSPAQAAGILPGDKITAIDGVAISKWDDILKEISGTEKERLSIEIIRNGEKLTLETGIMTREDGRKMVGISPAVGRNPLTALVRGAQASYDLLVNMVGILGMLFTGGAPMTELTGVVGIAYIVDDTAKAGFRPLLYLVSLISLNLAIVNMLPFPALDGGRLLFLAIRKVTGRAISDKLEAKIHLAGLVLLLALMVYVTWNDIGRFIINPPG